MLLPLIVFVLGAGLVIGVWAAVTYVPGALAARRLEQRLADVSAPMTDRDSVSTVIAKQAEGPLPALDRLASRTRAGSWLGGLIEQSGKQVTPSGVIMSSLLCAALAFVAATIFARQPLLPYVAAWFAAIAPIGYLMRNRAMRLRRFEEQFPEALDLMARAIRAGHAFQTALGMAADELGDPVGPEFKKTFDQQNYGLPMRDALNAMTDRVPMIDVRFFVTSVLIQRETGGNLAEILDNLAHVVRERFKILRQVRVHTAHGRFTGYVLLALPAALLVALNSLNHEAIAPLFKEHMGQMMLLGAVVLQTIGYFWIRQVIKIEV
jgi:tight adherence protein B